MKLPELDLIWQSPKFFKYSGLYLKVNNNRYCILSTKGWFN